ncbi:Tetratricopeptide repeat protein 1-like protein [Rhynchospora pubera]|uniref:Tetratricopeptide repeat protein 1-like protein n=1 Tax=Rhynchospora pubera TaxID=906938 RepID=A0AAV8EU98_9POAL|nr:Tetratricopeptide repeat protein 1-like protein [Rhynchospora pubera]
MSAEALKDEGNSQFKAGNYLKAAALYTQAIKLQPTNATLYSNRSAAFLHLVKLTKALADADTTISLHPDWEKGYFRRGCVLEAMHRYDHALSAFQLALHRNPHNSEVSSKIKRLTQLARETKRLLQVDTLRSNINISNLFQPFQSDLNHKCGQQQTSQEMFSFVIEVIESAIKVWHDTSAVPPRVHFLLDKLKTDTDKFAPVVNIDKAFESPDTHRECYPYLRQYAVDSYSKAACMIAPKSSISYPQVWKGQGSRKWKLAQSDGFFVQFESPMLRKLWFVPSSTEKGRTLCKNPELLDISVHEVVPRIFKEASVVI